MKSGEVERGERDRDRRRGIEGERLGEREKGRLIGGEGERESD